MGRATDTGKVHPTSRPSRLLTEMTSHIADNPFPARNSAKQVWDLYPSYGKKYEHGLYRVNDMWLYTNRGIGVIPPPVRINCRPEITEIFLTGGMGIGAPNKDDTASGSPF